MITTLRQSQRGRTSILPRFGLGLLALSLGVVASGARPALATPAAALAHVAMGNHSHAALSAHDVTATLDIKKTDACHVQMVWNTPDGSTPSPCNVAFLTLQDTASPNSQKTSFPLTLYGPDDGVVQLEMSIRQLDRSSALPQVLVTAFTGGAHCCSVTSIFDRNSAGGWGHLELGERDGGGEPDVEDILGNGQQEILTTDQSFLYTFASHAGSWTPLVISRYHDGTLETVTRDRAYHAFLRSDLERRRAEWIKGGRFEPNGFLAYALATSANLGDFSDAWRKLIPLASAKDSASFGLSPCDLKPTADQRNCTPAEKKQLPFPEALAAFLVRQGYVTPQQVEALSHPTESEPAKNSPEQKAPEQNSSTQNPPQHTTPQGTSALAAPLTSTSNEAQSASSTSLWWTLVPIGLIVYLLPALIAFRRHVRVKAQVATIAILLGWTVIGWIVALRMALSEPAQSE